MRGCFKEGPVAATNKGFERAFHSESYTDSGRLSSKRMSRRASSADTKSLHLMVERNRVGTDGLDWAKHKC